LTGYNLLVTDEISLEALDLLQKEAEVSVVYKPEISRNELLQLIGQFDAMIVRSRTKITSEVINAGKKLKIIGRVGVGIDNIDVGLAEKRGIKVLNTPDALTESVAELTVGLMLALARKIHYADKSVKDGLWIKNELEGFELSGKSYGTVGIGRIGLRVAKLAKAFGMRIIAYDIIEIKPEIIKELDLRVTSLDELLTTSDFVDLHVPLSAETYHMINAEKLSKMKKGAILINTSRGPVVDEEALLESLTKGQIGGAALDVYETEPPDGKKFAAFPNVVCTPHIGGQTREAQEKAGTMIAHLVLSELRKQKGEQE
jgi:D-3-phosphoglycerate dehydrogenase